MQKNYYFLISKTKIFSRTPNQQPPVRSQSYANIKKIDIMFGAKFVPEIIASNQGKSFLPNLAIYHGV
jgi:hypothetical protein